ncbi:MAG: hypothetical protein ACYCXF_07110 [Thermoleophilia bacterium]
MAEETDIRKRFNEVLRRDPTDGELERFSESSNYLLEKYLFMQPERAIWHSVTIFDSREGKHITEGDNDSSARPDRDEEIQQSADYLYQLTHAAYLNHQITAHNRLMLNINSRFAKRLGLNAQNFLSGDLEEFRLRILSGAPDSNVRKNRRDERRILREACAEALEAMFWETLKATEKLPDLLPTLFRDISAAKHKKKIKNYHERLIGNQTHSPMIKELAEVLEERLRKAAENSEIFAASIQGQRIFDGVQEDARNKYEYEEYEKHRRKGGEAVMYWQEVDKQSHSSAGPEEVLLQKRDVEIFRDTLTICYELRLPRIKADSYGEILDFILENGCIPKHAECKALGVSSRMLTDFKKDHALGSVFYELITTQRAN